MLMVYILCMVKNIFQTKVLRLLMQFHLKNMLFQSLYQIPKMINLYLSKNMKDQRCHIKNLLIVSNVLIVIIYIGLKKNQTQKRFETPRAMRSKVVENPKRLANLEKTTYVTRQTCYTCGIPGRLARNFKHVPTRHNHH